MTTTTHPRTYATVTGPHATFTTLDGRTEPLHATDSEDIRHAIVRRATHEAARTGTPVELVTRGDRGDHHLLVATDGTLTPLDPDELTEQDGDADELDGLGSDATVRASVKSTRRGHGADTTTRGEVREETPQPHPDDATPEAAAESPTRPTFLTPTPETGARRTGWRGALTRLGLPVAPSRAERGRAERLAVVSRHWAGCRTLAVANGKGGVGKTMTTAMLAAVYARQGGGSVLAWDNNDTRGTLGWRTEPGLYDTTVRDLLPATETLLSTAAGVSDITRFVHHQATDRYDVLRSNPELLATDQRIATSEFDLLMQVAARYYRLVIFDSGNDESAERWLRMIDSTYGLVIPTLASPESAESAALLLDALARRNERGAALAADAVVVVTQSEPGTSAQVRSIADGFTGHVRAVETIPFDPALKSGPLRFDALHRRTQDAWLRIAAAAATTL